MCDERSSHGNSFPGNKESVERPGCYGAGKGRQEAGSFRVLSGAQDTPLLPEGGDMLVASDRAEPSCVCLSPWLRHLGKIPLGSC